MDTIQLGPGNPLAQANGRPFNSHQLHMQRSTSLQQQKDSFATIPMCKSRKRKAESQNNERLSKRLSLLNLEKNGQKLYVPVETPIAESSAPPSSAATAIQDDGMRLDDTKHKVYIYDIDAELSSTDDENSESESLLPGSPTSGKGRLVFLPDIEKHLRRTRIPPVVFANPDGELAGHNINDMQMVLYRDSEPSSLTVAPEYDSVRKAILEARARMREKQKEDSLDNSNSATKDVSSITNNGIWQMNIPGFVQNATPWRESPPDDEDDAMEID